MIAIKAMSDNKQIRPGRIDALTGLRFLAALMVFCFHFDRSLKTNFFFGPMGGIAVSFFFVLSGFILTYVYRDRLKLRGIKRFYFTRWARIWPLHAVCLLASIYLVPYTPPVDFPGLRFASQWLLLQSWIPDLSYVLSYNGVAWSISTEAFFYLMFPMFLLGGLRNFWWKFIATIGLTALALFAITKISADPQWSGIVDSYALLHFNPFMRLSEFVIGMATAHVFMSSRIGSVKLLQISRWPVIAQTGIEVVVLLLAGCSYYMLLNFGYYGWVTRGIGLGGVVSMWAKCSGGMLFHALCIFVFAQSNGWIGRFFSTRIMIYLGEISFALYMVHRIVIILMINNFWSGSSLPYWMIISSTLAITIGVSSLLFMIVEMPMKNALLKFYDRKFATGSKLLLNQILELFKRKTVYVSFALALVPVLLMNESKDAPNPLTAQKIIAESLTPQVNFGNQIQLMAWHFEPKRMGTEVSLVWQNMEEPTWLRHEYLLVGTKFNQKGKFRLKNDLFVQRFFVRNRYWNDGESFDLKLWKKDSETLLTSNLRTTEEGESFGRELSYRVCIRPEANKTSQSLTARPKVGGEDLKKR